LREGEQPVEAPEREAAILELSTTLHDAKLRAERLAENVPEMLAVVQALRHADAMLDMVWDLHECTSYGDSVLDLEWGSSVDG
jgi:hypothetical protein